MRNKTPPTPVPVRFSGFPDVFANRKTNLSVFRVNQTLFDTTLSGFFPNTKKMLTENVLWTPELTLKLNHYRLCSWPLRRIKRRFTYRVLFKLNTHIVSQADSDVSDLLLVRSLSLPVLSFTYDSRLLRLNRTAQIFHFHWFTNK